MHYLLQYFSYAHLPAHLQVVSKPFCDTAKWMVGELPDNPERTVALRKLLEAKDCAVRAVLFTAETNQPTETMENMDGPCPRRFELGATSNINNVKDAWVKRVGRKTRTCSYCGGIHPEDAIEAVRNGAKVEATSKDYKRYLIGECVPSCCKVYVKHFTGDQLVRFNQAVTAQRPAREADTI